MFSFSYKVKEAEEEEKNLVIFSPQTFCCSFTSVAHEALSHSVSNRLFLFLFFQIKIKREKEVPSQISS